MKGSVKASENEEKKKKKGTSHVPDRSSSVLRHVVNAHQRGTGLFREQAVEATKYADFDLRVHGSLRRLLHEDQGADGGERRATDPPLLLVALEP